MNLNELQNPDMTFFDTLLEGVTDFPEGTSVEDQIDILISRLAAGKRATGIANKIKDPANRKKHKGRVMGFMNKLRPMLRKITAQLEKEQAE